jgi:hypothetical protein
VGENYKNVDRLPLSNEEDKDKVELPVRESIPNSDKFELIRQIECRYEPVVALWKLTQRTGCIIFDYLFWVHLTIQNPDYEPQQLHDV